MTERGDWIHCQLFLKAAFIYSYLTEEGIGTVCENQQQNVGTFWKSFLGFLQWEKSGNNRKTQLKIARAHFFRMISSGSTPWAASKAEWPAEWGRWFCSALAEPYLPPEESPYPALDIIFCVVLSIGKTWPCWNKFRVGHRNDQKAGAPLLQKQAELSLACSASRREGCGDTSLWPSST